MQAQKRISYINKINLILEENNLPDRLPMDTPMPYKMLKKQFRRLEKFVVSYNKRLGNPKLEKVPAIVDTKGQVLIN